MAGRQTIFIEETEDELRCLASPQSLIPTFIVAGAIGLLLALVGVQAGNALVAELRRTNPKPYIELFVTTLWLALLVGVCIAVILTIRRQRSKHGIVIEEGVVKLFTPEQGKAEHQFSRGELAGSVLSTSAKRSDQSSLTVRRRRGSTIKLLIGYPVTDLSRVMDAVNRKVVHEQFAGFQVLLTETTPSVAAETTLTTPVVAQPVRTVPPPIPPARVLPIEERTS